MKDNQFPKDVMLDAEIMKIYWHDDSEMIKAELKTSKIEV